ncbi:MAG: caspase family protein [Chitinispirillales bacterium]|jgi:hypothetical protein|nr:caspase family protein [Chitinispirillales bacterium]
MHNAKVSKPVVARRGAVPSPFYFISALCVIIFAFVSTAAPSQEPTEIRRYMLSVGANNGGRERVLLRYAVTDARAFASILTEMGGVDRQNSVILANPGRDEFLSAVTEIEVLIAKDRGSGVRSEAFIYYSGHADIDGLKLGGETLSWYDFRSAVNNLGADIRVAIVDACGSGAVTRTKGGIPRPAFMLDASKNMKGYAFLASSNANEASQESDRIKGSYFTHALLNGMRGAADLTGDGTVTINEAYSYAFNETLRSTQNTSAGTQHPSRDMNLAGTGDIVMTDLRRTSAILALGPGTEGRFFIRDASGNLFAELHKQGGRQMDLGIPHGRYSVQMETQSGTWTANNVVTVEGGKTALSMSDMRKTNKKKTTARGNGDAGYGPNTLSGFQTLAYNSIFDATLYGDVSGSVGASLRVGVPWFYCLVEYNTIADIKYIEKSKPGTNDPSSHPSNSWPINPNNPNMDTDYWDDKGLGEVNEAEPWRLHTAPGYAGFGIGTRFGMNGPFFVNLDLINRALGHKDRDHDFYRVRLGAAYNPSPYFAITAGASVNGIINRKGGLVEYEPSKRYSGNNGARVWPDIYAGLTTGKILAGRKYQ